jgi:hypothetical protein
VDWLKAVSLYGLRSMNETPGLLDFDFPIPAVPIQHPPERVTAGAPPTKPRTYCIPVQPEGLESSLFENRGELKLLTGQVAMHLSAEERRSLFSSIDRLLDIANWEDESSQIDIEAFRTYLRFTIHAHPRRIPNLGVSSDGALLAAWRKDDRSVHVEFLRNDQCEALVKSRSERGPETIAWRGHVARLRPFITSNGEVECLD